MERWRGEGDDGRLFRVGWEFLFRSHASIHGELIWRIVNHVFGIGAGIGKDILPDAPWLLPSFCQVDSLTKAWR